MKNVKNFFKKTVVKYGACIAAFAFVFATVSANTTCAFPFYEPEEPSGFDELKKFNK